MECSFGPQVTEPYVELGDKGQEVQEYRTRHRWQARVTFRQVALWHDYETVFEWLNPLIWYRKKDGGLHFRRKPIEYVN